MLKKEFDFELKEPLTYSSNGRAGLTSTRLFLRAPTAKYIALAGQISALVMAAFFKVQDRQKTTSKGETQETTDKFDGESLYAIVSSSLSSKEVDVFLELMTQLLLSPSICFVDGVEPLTRYLLESLDARELLRLIGDYIANFLLPSLMQT